MRIIIGCAPGSGSSLLHSLLSNHSLIYGDEESHIYAKPKLISDWKNAKLGTSITQLKSQGWHMFNGFNPRSNIVRTIVPLINKAEHQSFESFTKEIELRVSDQNQTQHWLDKTPGNIYSFEALHAHEVQCHKIIIVRNPFDNVASLMARGDSVFHAVAQCVTSLTKVALVQKSLGIHLVRYEDLVRDAQLEIEKICSTFGVASEPVWNRSGEGSVKMKGWQYYEDGKIGTNSIGRYLQLASSKQAEVTNAIKQIYTNPGCSLFDNVSWNLLDLAAQFDYDIPKLPDVTIRLLQSEMHKDKLTRTLRLYPTNILNYPIKLNA